MSDKKCRKAGATHNMKSSETTKTGIIEVPIKILERAIRAPSLVKTPMNQSDADQNQSDAPWELAQNQTESKWIKPNQTG